MPIWHAIDETRRSLHITLSGTVRGPEFSTFACGLYGERPDLFDYACILDLLAFEGDVIYADLNSLQTVYDGERKGDSASRPGFIVTLDPNFHFWAAALDHQFPGRQHFLATTVAAAFLRLDELQKIPSPVVPA
jgi:hypothetical protein